MDQSPGLHSDSGGSTENQSAESPKHHKSKSGPELVSLSRCAGCYNQSSVLQWGDSGESSSSAEDTGPEPDWESEPESSCSSCSSEQVLVETPEKPDTEEHSAVSGDAAEPQSGGQDDDGLAGEQVLVEMPEKPDTEEHSAVSGDAPEPQSGGQDDDGLAGEQVLVEMPEKPDTEEHSAVSGDAPELQSGGQDDDGQEGETAPLVKPFSLPSSFTRHLTPMSLLPHPPRVVSIVHLQVLPEKHDSDTFYTFPQHLSEREEDKTEESTGGIDSLLPPQLCQHWQQGLPGQWRSEPSSPQHQYQQQQLPHLHQQPPHQLSHQYQLQQQPQLFFPLSAQGQRLPPPPHSLPVLPPPTLHTPLQVPNAPQTHLHALAPQTCWCCYRLHFDHTYWSQ